MSLDFSKLEIRPAGRASLARKIPYHFPTKVVGVTHKNDDGADRQELIRLHAHVGQPVILIPEPDNPYGDENTLSVWIHKFHSPDIIKIGYISNETDNELAQAIRNNIPVDAKIKGIHGGTEEKPTRGVAILVYVGGEQISEDAYESKYKSTPQNIEISLLDLIEDEDLEEDNEDIDVSTTAYDYKPLSIVDASSKHSAKPATIYKKPIKKRSQRIACLVAIFGPLATCAAFIWCNLIYEIVTEFMKAISGSVP